MVDRNPAFDGPMGVFADFEGCDSGIETDPEAAALLNEAGVEMNSIMTTGRLTSDPLPEPNRGGRGVIRRRKRK